VRRKLTTIVAADVVGYSRLIGEDEGGTLEALDILRTRFIAPLAETHGGRIFRFLGDGTLMEFESAMGAVECGIALQRGLADHNATMPLGIPLLLRIGINLGDVIFEGDDIHGEGVNIAVRLETLAEPGGLCLTEIVHAQVKNRIKTNFIPIGPRRLKNIVDPVEVWRWRPSSDAPTVPLDEPLKRDEAGFNGQHLIDAKVIDALMHLHGRSALLAISDALDAVSGEAEDSVRIEQLYYHVSEQLQQAQALLNRIKIERIDNYQDFTSNGSKYQTLGEFVASLFNDSKAGFAFKILPEAHAILSSNDRFIIKRKRFMELIRRFHNDDFIARSRSLIKFGYVD
jgi:class 3 adenylate cyclase